ncbi:TRAP transporter permease [Acuticoccus mangrovi]|uniref:TRAP transporter fused permease subunit n=1 Tax=Acuticoccus mangrovi TaxID=2796142 RepID=A0A934MGF1_9HYPH|nr:TRAP transporter fused permease subunit [Acuticoccus mangrovi]MBJ3774911.1 TRAP transporter fused permease subunit [Acuticoccus mangrovi]
MTPERTRDAAIGSLSALLVIASLAFVTDLPRRFGVVLFTEQQLAIALALAAAAGVFLALNPKRVASLVAAALLAVVTLVVLGMIAADYPTLSIKAAMRPTDLVVIATFIVALVLFLVWRLIGLPLVLLVLLFVGLAIYGGPLGVPETTPARVPLYLALDANALLGLPLRVAIEVVIPFVLFGELLRVTGGGEFLTRLAVAAFGGYRGGAAKAAIGASAVFGTVSGNAVSNVVGTGVVTIPLIKRTGFTGPQAAAIEAVASTGGQLLPPVMGAAAFVMADLLRVPYTDILIAAALPALLYFAAVTIQVDRLAAKRGIRGLAAAERPRIDRAALAGAHFALPFIAMFGALFAFETRPQYAALAASAVLIVVAAVVRFDGRRLGLSGILDAVIATGRASVPLVAIVAAAGLLIGLISLTGLGFSLALDVIRMADGSSIVLLALVALCAIVFGMGMPTVAVYVVLATVLAPALVKAGFGEMQAHLFIFYFGMMSMLTPPVALASITAARIAEADPWVSSFVAVRLAWVAYLVPFLFAFSTPLLLDGPVPLVVAAVVTGFGGILAVSMALAGYGARPLGLLMRLAFAAAGLMLLVPFGLGTVPAALNILGAALLLALLGRDSLARLLRSTTLTRLQ